MDPKPYIDKIRNNPQDDRGVPTEDVFRITTEFIEALEDEFVTRLYAGATVQGEGGIGLTILPEGPIEYIYVEFLNEDDFPDQDACMLVVFPDSNDPRSYTKCGGEADDGTPQHAWFDVTEIAASVRSHIQHSKEN